MIQLARGAVPRLAAAAWCVLAAGGAAAQTCTNVELSAMASSPAGPGPRGLALGDFNEDGVMDVVVSNPSVNAISILISDGTGGFGPPASFPATSPGEIAVADFNRDAHLDVAAASQGSIVVLYGTGSGALGPPTGYGSIVFPNDVATGDVDGDGRLDLVAVSSVNGLSVLRATSGGGFGAQTDVAISSPRAVAVADVNGDGYADAAVVQQAANSVSVFLGTGTGAFGPPTAYPTGAEPVSVILEDLDADGHVDLAVGMWSFAPNVSVRRGNGTGAFGSAAGFGGTSGAIALATGDLDLDARDDLVIAGYHTGVATVATGIGAGAFGPPEDFAMGSGPTGIGVADFDRDGRADVVVSNNTFGSDTVTVRLNRWNPGVRDGGFEAGSPWTAWPFQFSSQFGTPLCDVPTCGTGGGSAPPFAGGNWAWFGGTPALPEIAVVGQPMRLPASPGLRLAFQLRRGFVSAPFTDELGVVVDGTLAALFSEPALPEGGYVRREVDLSAWADGGCHDVVFEYHHVDAGVANMTVDDITLPPALAIDDVTLAEGNEGTRTAVFRVSRSGAPGEPVTVQFATQDGTAAGGDYSPVGGTLDFPPGVVTREVHVPVAGDTDFEADETFAVILTSPVGAAIADSRGTGRITNDDLRPLVSVEPTAVVEGDAGTVTAQFTVRLATLSHQAGTVTYETANGTATAPADYAAATGTVTFPPGTSTRTIAVAVNGDVVPEPDEGFLVRLTGATGVEIEEQQAEALIVDDDAPSLANLELSHGFRQTYALPAGPGPEADVDYFRLRQEPNSSYEIVVDAASGDVQPLLLERLSADGSAVLQTGTPTGVGASVSLRWANTLSVPVANQHIRVRSGGCSTDCDPDDEYRLRAYETTASVPRFNNAGTQATAVVLQNPTGEPIAGRVLFWDTAGNRLDAVPFTLLPHATTVLASAARPLLAGRSGSITIAHDARYGVLTGKAVSLEPSSGYSFDSPVVPRAR
jgi:hypothetical protein